MNNIIRMVFSIALCMSAPAIASDLDYDNTVYADARDDGKSRKRTRTKAHEQEHVQEEHFLTADPKKNKSEEATDGDTAPLKSILKKSSYGPNIASGKKHVSWALSMRVRLFANPLTHLASGGWRYDLLPALPSRNNGEPQEGTETFRDVLLTCTQRTPEQLGAPRHMDLSQMYPPLSVNQLLRHEKLMNLFEAQASRAKLAWNSQHNWLKDNSACNDDFWLALCREYEAKAIEAMAIVEEEDVSDENDNTDYDLLRLQAGEYYTKAAACLLASFGSVMLDEDGHPDCLDENTLADCPEDMARYINLLTSAMKCNLDGVEEYAHHIHKACRGFFQSIFGLLQTMKDNPNWKNDLAVCKKCLDDMENLMKTTIEVTLEFKDHEIDDCPKCQDIFKQLKVAKGLYEKIWAQLNPRL